MTSSALVDEQPLEQAVAAHLCEIAPHPALRRLDPTTTLADDAWLDAGIPADADPWLRTSWHFREQTLGWSCGRAVVRSCGRHHPGPQSTDLR
ncbi:MAG: hypothetical protein ACRDYX_05020 [Egibacteraceae bacterium]